MMAEIIEQVRSVPEYFHAFVAAATVLASGFPIYIGLRYFLYKRQLKLSAWETLHFVGVFILFSGLAFLLASPLALGMTLL